MRTANPEKIAQQRSDIVAAAIRTFGRRGLSASSTDDICKEAGISPGRLYYYFKSRDALIDAVLQHLDETSDALATEKFAVQDSVPDIMATYLGAIEKYLVEVGYTHSLQREILNLAERNPKVRRHVRGGYQKANTLVMSALERQRANGKLRRDADVEALGLAVVLAVSGAQLLDVTSGRVSVEQIRKVVDTIVSPWMVDARAASEKPSKRSRSS